MHILCHSYDIDSWVIRNLWPGVVNPNKIWWLICVNISPATKDFRTCTLNSLPPPPLPHPFHIELGAEVMWPVLTHEKDELNSGWEKFCKKCGTEVRQAEHSDICYTLWDVVSLMPNFKNFRPESWNGSELVTLSWNCSLFACVSLCVTMAHSSQKISLGLTGNYWSEI